MKLWIAAWNESKVKKICDFVFGSWTWYSNMDKCDKGCRIVVGWNEDNVNIMVLHSSQQAILCLIELKDSKNKFFYYFVYAANSGKDRRVLWRDLKKYRRVIDDKPWVLMGD
ncbi:RNA-directed DNA polymerase, eukaryota, reverse transcriptase zinc-binding domain protein [Tanacetum coccineum]